MSQTPREKMLEIIMNWYGVRIGKLPEEAQESFFEEVTKENAVLDLELILAAVPLIVEMAREYAVFKYKDGPTTTKIKYPDAAAVQAALRGEG